MSLDGNDGIRNHLVANPIELQFYKLKSFSTNGFGKQDSWKFQAQLFLVFEVCYTRNFIKDREKVLNIWLLLNTKWRTEKILLAVWVTNNNIAIVLLQGDDIKRKFAWNEILRNFK